MKNLVKVSLVVAALAFITTGCSSECPCGPVKPECVTAPVKHHCKKHHHHCGKLGVEKTKCDTAK
ncbi:MAG: hypothetical protein M1561_06695 [Gammaproteobacteria bacterium]|nr:hypothetical protein [Gammaproteobacteria bacterium]